MMGPLRSGATWAVPNLCCAPLKTGDAAQGSATKSSELSFKFLLFVPAAIDLVEDALVFV